MVRFNLLCQHCSLDESVHVLCLTCGGLPSLRTWYQDLLLKWKRKKKWWNTSLPTLQFGWISMSSLSNMWMPTFTVCMVPGFAFAAEMEWWDTCLPTLQLAESIPVIFENNNKNTTALVRKVARSYKSFNIQSFHEDLGKINWAHVCRYKDVNIAYRVFYDMFVKVCDNHAPNVEHNVSRKKNGPKNPWISSAINKSIRKKHTLYTPCK